MLNFNYRNPTHVVFGKDRMEELDQLVPANARVLITYGGGSVQRFGTLDKSKRPWAIALYLNLAALKRTPNLIP
jgi:alcohol dehydrogenase YqhD (iron-dependent ADH family)